MPDRPAEPALRRRAPGRAPAVLPKRYRQRRLRRDLRSRERALGRGVRGGGNRARVPRVLARTRSAAGRARQADAVLGRHRAEPPRAGARPRRRLDPDALGLRGGSSLRVPGGEARRRGAGLPRLSGDELVAEPRRPLRQHGAERGVGGPARARPGGGRCPDHGLGRPRTPAAPAGELPGLDRGRGPLLEPGGARGAPRRRRHGRAPGPPRLRRRGPPRRRRTGASGARGRAHGRGPRQRLAALGRPHDRRHAVSRQPGSRD